MKWWGLLVCLSALLMVTVLAAAQPGENGAAWLAAIDEAESVEASYGVMSQTITTSTGSERTLELKSWSAEGGQVSLMVYTAPARVEGDKILTREGGDHVWYYMSRRDVTKHFVQHARRQRAMGSDFSYEDLSQGDLTEDYTAEFLGFEELEGEECVKLRCTPTESGPSYDDILLWAARSDSLSRRIEYFEEGEHVKTLYLSDFHVVEGRRVAMRMKMVNHEEGSQTVLETRSITFDVDPPASRFTKRALPEEL